VAEFAKFTVTLRGQELTEAYGHTMRFVRAQTEAGAMPLPPEGMPDLKPGDEMTPDVSDYLLKFTNWQRSFVQAYYKLMPEFMEDCTADEVVKAFAAITEAAQCDPFGQLPEKPQPDSATKSEPPTTGS
jgi:hypothetical protein